ncbi:MAG: type IV secretory system conjugative DNA transfer family protein, partial [Cetobacterium sp.]|nr:type IV secretory system conjugative DNA transfer family protein [Cetobacterium sp.]
ECNDYGSHGTAKFKPKYEIEKLNKDNVGWFLGSVEKVDDFSINEISKNTNKHEVKKINKKNKNYVYKPVNSDLNMQMTVIGPPGSQKTTGFVFPNIFHICNAYKNLEEKADLIITDPKTEIYRKTADYLEKNGYEVKVLDFWELKYGDAFNPLDFISDDKDLLEISEGYIRSVLASFGTDFDAFWDGQQSQLLGALMGFVKQKRPKEHQTFSEVLRILTSENVSDVENAKTYFDENKITGASLKLWKNYLSIVCEAPETKSGINGGLSEKLKLFTNQEIENITSKTTIDIKKFGRKKDKPMALFIFMRDCDRTYSPLINVIITTIFKQLYTTAYETGNKLENPVYFILEEMANIGKISGMQEMLGTMRGRRIYPMMIWQSLSQMKDRYNDGFEDIMSMCDTHVYLGVNDDFTAEYCSKSLGDTTIKVANSNTRKDSINYSEGESDSYQKRRLLFSDECMIFDNDKMIVRQRANDPMILYKTQYKYWEKQLCKDKFISDLKLLPKYVPYEDIEEVEETDIIFQDTNLAFEDIEDFTYDFENI